jgi:hypothetical protein
LPYLFTNHCIAFHWPIMFIKSMVYEVRHTFDAFITNLTCAKIKMKIVWSSFIHRFVHFMHEYHALKICLTHDRFYGWNTNLWMNECHMDLASFFKIVFQMCFQCTILMWETYELWMNKFCTISIIKSWDVKFVMLVGPPFCLWLLQASGCTNWLMAC